MKVTIDELLKKADVFGTGFVPNEEENWWFAIGNEKYWKKDEGKLKISFTAIGGHVEKGESFIEATLREVKEETGADAILHDVDKSFFISAVLEEKELFNFQIKEVMLVDISDQPKPWIVYLLKRNMDYLGVVVYRGKFKQEPYPNAEVPALICVPSNLLLKTPASLGDLLSIGCQIREQDETSPKESIIYTFGTTEIIKHLLIN